MKTIIERIDNLVSVNAETECWEWIGATEQPARDTGPARAA